MTLNHSLLPCSLSCMFLSLCRYNANTVAYMLVLFNIYRLLEYSFQPKRVYLSYFLLNSIYHPVQLPYASFLHNRMCESQPTSSSSSHPNDIWCTVVAWRLSKTNSRRNANRTFTPVPRFIKVTVRHPLDLNFRTHCHMPHIWL